MSKINQRIVDFVIIFGVTLQAYYFYQINLAPFPLISVLFLIIFKNKLSKIEISYFLLLLVFIGFSIIIGLINSVVSGIGIYVNSILGVVIGIVTFILFRNRFIARKKDLVRTIGFVLWIHAAAFIIQTLAFYQFGLEIDYVRPLTYEESRSTAVGVLSGIIRPTGLTTEPAGYCIYMCILVFIRLVLSNKLKIIDYVIFVTCFISFSLSGILLSLSLLFFKFLFFSKKLKEIIIALSFSSLIFLFSLYFFYDLYEVYYQTRFLNLADDTSANERFVSGTNLFLNEPFLTQFFGLGVGFYPYTLAKGVSSSGSGIQSMFTTWGFFMLFIFFVLNGYFFKKSQVKLKSIFLWFILMFGGQTITLVSFWILLSGMWLSGSIKSKNHNG